MNNHKKHYTESDLDIIRSNYPNMGDREIGKLIGRSAISIQKKRQELDIFSKKFIKIGDIFGRLVIVGKDEDSVSGNPYYLARCSCDGKITTIRGSSLSEGLTTSCGCYNLEINTKKEGVSSWNTVISGYKYGAKVREHTFSLTYEIFVECATQNCHYCGSTPSHKFNKYLKKDGTPTHTKRPYSKEIIDRAWIVYTGIDRIDNNRGYEVGNILPCCTICNHAKHTTTYQEFIEYLDRLVRFRAKV